MIIKILIGILLTTAVYADRAYVPIDCTADHGYDRCWEA